MMTRILVIMISWGIAGRQPDGRIARREAVAEKFLFEVRLIVAGARLNRSRSSGNVRSGPIRTATYRSSGLRPVTFDRRANMRGPISSRS
jgi:hypothetical protein